MAVAIIGGLVTSTVLTLGIVPVVYSLLDGVRARFFRPAADSDSGPAADTPSHARAANEQPAPPRGGLARLPRGILPGVRRAARAPGRQATREAHMRKIVVAVVALALLAPAHAHALAFVGARVGYALPSGDVQKGAPMKDSIASNVPIQLDAGLSMLNIMSLGVYGSYGPTQVKSQCVSCSGSEIRGGVQLNLRPPLVLKELWGGAFAGYQRQSLKNSAFDQKFSGWEAGLQAGWDFSLLPLIGIGPYVSYSVAQFTNASGATLGTKAQHQALTFGLRAIFDL